VQAARVRIDSRKWLLAKLRPEQYGDTVRLTGKDGRDLLPQTTPEARIPKLMAILSVVMPDKSNSELHALATTMVGKLNGSPAALPRPNGGDDGGSTD
jgi:hypothetical protein